MVDLVTFIVTDLLPLDFSKQIPTMLGPFLSRAVPSTAPAEVLVSTTDSYTLSYTWMDKQVFAVELTTNGRVVRLAHDTPCGVSQVKTMYVTLARYTEA